MASWKAASPTATTQPRKMTRCRQRRDPTRATIVPKRRSPIVHLDTKTVLTATIRLVSQPLRSTATWRSTVESHRSKATPSAL
jgi:hypothetical protein